MLWMFRWHFQCVYNVLVPPHTDALTWPCRMLHQNHYEVLGLEKTCSPADIREQFIRLSKEVCGTSLRDSTGINVNLNYVALSARLLSVCMFTALLSCDENS